MKSTSDTLLLAKGKTRLACLNVQSAGSLSAQSLHLQQIIETIDLMALSESHWQGHGITRVQSCTILHSGFDSSHTRGVAIVLSPHVCSAWEAAGSVFKPINDTMRVNNAHLLEITPQLHYSNCRLRVH